MPKKILPNFFGSIKFIEDAPVIPNVPNQSDATIIDINVTPEISDNLGRIIIYFDFETSFFLGDEILGKKSFLADMKYDQQKFKHYSYLDGIKMNCDFFKQGHTIHILGYMFPDEDKGLRKFYFHGIFNPR